MKTTIETLAGNLPADRGSRALTTGTTLTGATGSVRRAIYYNDPDPAD